MGRNILTLIRYRFFLFAGILPYLLGQAIAYNAKKSLDWQPFWLGFVGIFFVLAGVECFNEYFDAKEGTDRIFAQEISSVPRYILALGISLFILALSIGILLAFRSGWLILLFSFLGALGAYFYVGPPIRWAYRGFGELVIALSYGPLMVMGSYYLQVNRLDIAPLFASIISGLSIFGLAILNEIPDYYQDQLVGKRNLVVRLGKKGGLALCGAASGVLFILLFFSIAFKKIPLPSAAAFLLIPWLAKTFLAAQKNCENPREFAAAIRTSLLSHLGITFSLCLGYLTGVK